VFEESAYNKMLRYVCKLLNTGKNRTLEKNTNPIRNRAEHTKRVLMWINRLSISYRRIDNEALIIAAIFHDSGYSKYDYKNDDHGKASSEICSNYLKRYGYTKERIAEITYLIRNHSNKTMMHDKNTSKELILLMEADLLDETGSLAIVKDCMYEAHRKKYKYDVVYKYLNSRAEKILENNPMVTSKGKKYWAEKQKVMALFLKNLEYDIFISSN